MCNKSAGCLAIQISTAYVLVAAADSNARNASELRNAASVKLFCILYNDAVAACSTVSM